MSMPGGVRGGDREESPYSIVQFAFPLGLVRWAGRQMIT
jgi:hypothetical protein